VSIVTTIVMLQLAARRSGRSRTCRATSRANPSGSSSARPTSSAPDTPRRRSVRPPQVCSPPAERAPDLVALDHDDVGDVLFDQCLSVRRPGDDLIPVGCLRRRPGGVRAARPCCPPLVPAPGASAMIGKDARRTSARMTRHRSSTPSGSSNAITRSGRCWTTTSQASMTPCTAMPDSPSASASGVMSMLASDKGTLERRRATFRLERP